MVDQELEKRVGEITEWWKEENRETFIALGERLLDVGMPSEEVYRILEEFFHTVASEYGD